ncbi:MAG: phage major capsid protein, partial [Lachnospiraceae bacterium]
MPTGVERYDINAVMEPQIIAQVIEGIVSKSAALTMFTQLPNMTSDKTKMRVLSGLPTAYWVDESANNGRKNITKQMWANKYIVAEELAVIVPIKENLLNDADIDLWASIQPRIVEAFAKKIDEAVFTGVDKPAGFRADILTSITQCGAVVTQGDTL